MIKCWRLPYSLLPNSWDCISYEKYPFWNVFQIEEIKSKGGDEAQNVEELLQQQGHLIEEIFSHDDKDKDGYISHEEFSGPKHDEL